MKSKKGFTLIELLAVIVVLGIIMLIAVTAVSNYISTSKVNAFLLDEKMFVKATQKYLAAGVVNYPSNIGDTIEVRLSDLQSNGFIERIKSPSNQSIECEGYLIVTKIEIGKYDYTPHLDCLNGIGSVSEDSLVAHYTFDDFQEPTTNIFPRNHQNLAFTSAYNGTNYSFGSSTNIQQIIDNSLRWDDRSAVTKVSRINSGIAQSDFACISIQSAINTTRVLSFWYYGTYGTTIRPYNNDSSADLYYLDNSGNWSGGGTAINIPVPQNQWKKITIKVVNRGLISGDGIDWIILHNNQGSATLSNTEYWAFTLFQYEEKLYATDFVVGSRTSIIKDYSGRNNTATLTTTNTPTWINTGKNSEGAYTFNGSSNYIDAGNKSDFNLTNTGTVMLWAKTTRNYPSDDTNYYFKGLISKTVGGGDGQQSYYIDWHGTNTSRYLRGAIGDANGQDVIQITNYNFNNEWNNIALVWNNSNVILYTNGKEAGRTNQTRNAQVTNKELEIGRAFSSNGYTFNGSIDDVRIYNRALSANEILQIYNSTK